MSDTNYIYFRRELPFNPIGSQIIYMEGRPYMDVNLAIDRNYDAINERLEKSGHEFCYFPKLSERLTATDYVRYFTPYDTSVRRGAMLGSDCLIPWLLHGTDAFTPSLVCFDGMHGVGGQYFYRFRRVELPFGTSSEQLLERIYAFADELYETWKKDNADVRYCCTTDADSYSTGDDPNYADEEYPEEVSRIMWEIRERVDKLRELGVGEMVINRLLMPVHRLSRLRIEADGRIILADYGEREIKMSPLTKAVFLLFLRHPEGIIFKHLPDYRDELQHIYVRLLGDAADNEKVLRSISDVTNPCHNSINEKCSRIREAFLQEISEPLARYYFVTGERATPKKILLDRKLVEWGEW